MSESRNSNFGSQGWLAAFVAFAACISCTSETLREPGISPAGDAAVDPIFGNGRRPTIDPLGNACAAETIRPQMAPLDLIFVVDTSGSMLEETASGMSKWDAFRAAFSSFARSPESSGVSASMGFFPLVQAGVPEECASDAQCAGFGPCTRAQACAGAATVNSCDSDADCGSEGPCVELGVCSQQGVYCSAVGERCSPRTDDICKSLPGRCAGREICSNARYSMAISDLVTLPAGATIMTTLLAKQKPQGTTPTGPALMGAIERARANLVARKDHRVAILLATDGLPTSCAPRSIDELEVQLTQSQLASPAIPIFVLGVFSPQEQSVASSNLARLARAGGTPNPFIVSTSGNTNTALLAALNDIRATALACDYEIPQAQRGQLDPQKVTIRFNNASGASIPIQRVAAPADCEANTGGWYYDPTASDPVNPKIKVCPATCELLRSDPGGGVDLVVGCKSMPVN